MPFLLCLGIVRSAAVRSPAAFPHRLVVFGLTVATATRLLTAAVDFIDGRPSSAFRLVLCNTPLLVAFLYVFRLPFLFVCVFGFVSARHLFLLIDGNIVQMAYRTRRLARGCY